MEAYDEDLGKFETDLRAHDMHLLEGGLCRTSRRMQSKSRARACGGPPPEAALGAATHRAPLRMLRHRLHAAAAVASVAPGHALGRQRFCSGLCSADGAAAALACSRGCTGGCC